MCHARSGVALVEFALFLPIISMLVFGAIETANMIYLRQGLTVAAYEVARSVSSNGSVQADAEARGYQALTARGINSATISVNPSVNSSTLPGTEITVTVIAPANANAVAPQWFFQGTTIRAAVTMARM